MTFRYAGEKDAGLVLEFLKRLSEYEKAEEHLVSTASMLAEELGRENGARALFVLAEGREVGCALFFRNFSGYLGRSGIFIDALIVLEEYRGKGYGKALFEELKKETKKTADCQSRESRRTVRFSYSLIKSRIKQEIRRE